MNAFPTAEIEKKLGYVFHNKNLLIEAFTHVSYAKRFQVKSNERLEYLGDAVLQFVVTEWQYRQNDDASEGTLTQMRQRLVCKDALDSAVDGLDVWQHILVFGTKYNVQGKAKSSLFEAIVAAIYLDGGYKKAKAFILQHGNVHYDIRVENPKGDLKEFLEKRGLPEPVYEVEKFGPDNAPYFRCTVYAQGESANGQDSTKRDAEKKAAARLLWELQRKEEN